MCSIPVETLAAKVVTAPLSSVTLPEMDPVLLCANAANGVSDTNSASTKMKRICFACLI